MSSPCATEKKKSKIRETFSPINTTTNVNSPTIPIFGSSTTAATVPFPTTFCSTNPALLVTVGGSCGGPLTFGILFTCPADGTFLVLSITCVGGVPTIAILTALPEPISPAPTVTISGLPIIGAVANSVFSTDPTVSQLCVRQEKCSTLVTGAISESINFTGVASPLSEAALSALASALLANLFSAFAPGTACGGTLLADTILSGITAEATIICAFPTLGDGLAFLPTATLADLFALIIAAIEPGVIAALRTALAVGTPVINQQVPPFGFALNVTDPSLRSVEKCDKFCATGSACFAGAVGAPLPVSSLPTNFTITATSPCASLIPVGAPILLSIPTADLLGAVSPSLSGATVLSELFCATVGTSCVAVSPAIVKTDKVSLVINHGKDICCPPFQSSSTSLPICPTPLAGFFPSSTFFPGVGF